jgi:hypothetical protein
VRAAKVEAYSFIAPIICDIQANRPGISFRGIAKALNEMGETTRYGSEWTAVQVMRVLQTRKEEAFERMDSLPPEGPQHEEAWRTYSTSVDAINEATAGSRSN